MLIPILIILLVLWLLGFHFALGGAAVHILLVIVVIVVLLNLFNRGARSGPWYW